MFDERLRAQIGLLAALVVLALSLGILAMPTAQAVRPVQTDSGARPEQTVSTILPTL